MLERTASGFEWRLKVAGFGRFIGAAFLSLWLLGWAVGEAFAVWALVGGGYSLLTGRTHQPVSLGFALAAGAFLLFWLTLWTLGGIAAGGELLRLLFGRDQFVADPESLKVIRSFGLFRSVKQFSRGQIRRFYRTSPRSPLSVETTDGKTETLTRLGTPAEQFDLEEALNGLFRLERETEPAGALPKEWCEVLSPERDSILVKDPAVRRKQARTVWILCACLSLIPMYLLSLDRQRPDLLGAIIFFFALAGVLCWGAVWLSFGRNEWRLEKGRLILQRRFGQNRTPRFEAVSLELIEDNSGEDGPSYLLVAVAREAPSRPSPWLHRQRQHWRTMCSRSDTPTEPRNFGLWLSHRCQIPFNDLATPEAKAIEMEALKQQLAASGRLGRAVVGIIDRLAPSSSADAQRKDGD